KTGKKVHYSSLPQFMTLPLSFPPSVPPSFSLSLSHTHTHTHTHRHTHTHTLQETKAKKAILSCIHHQWHTTTNTEIKLVIKMFRKLTFSSENINIWLPEQPVCLGLRFPCHIVIQIWDWWKPWCTKHFQVRVS